MSWRHYLGMQEKDIVERPAPLDASGQPVVDAEGEAAVIRRISAQLDAMPEVGVIVIARGGGGVEDLLPFSNEALVRAVAACRTPVVSAIGHEQDTPLIDLVADLRASTPTDAAKRIVPSLTEQLQFVATMRGRLRTQIQHRLDREQSAVAERQRRAHAIMTHQLGRSADDVRHLAARVRALSPASTLDRGYAIVTTTAGAIVRDSTTVTPGDQVRVRVASGAFSATVIEE